MIEKRKQKRKPFRKIIKVDGISAKIINVSENGISVEMPKKPVISSNVEIDFDLFKTYGAIRWILSSGYGRPIQIGIYIKDFQNYLYSDD